MSRPRIEPIMGTKNPLNSFVGSIKSKKKFSGQTVHIRTNHWGDKSAEFTKCIGVFPTLHARKKGLSK